MVVSMLLWPARYMTRGRGSPHSILQVIKVCLRQWRDRSLSLNNLSLYAESNANEFIDLAPPGNTNLFLRGILFIFFITLSCQISSVGGGVKEQIAEEPKASLMEPA